MTHDSIVRVRATGARIIREVIPYLLLPLCLLASVLSAAPWLRSFPLSVGGAPLYGAAVLSVLVPVVVLALRPGWIWLSVLVDGVVFVLYALLVVLQAPTGFGQLIEGLYRGPSELLTFALPLVSPRSLMVAPAALIWLAGALAGECVARRWATMLPYAGFLICFALAYAGTQRAAGSQLASARARETLIAGALLLTLLLMRAAQAWVRQDETAESTQPDGILPLRGLLVGVAVALVIALVAAFAVQSDVFPKRSAAPQRVPTVRDDNPPTPLSFVAGLRPRRADEPGTPVFSVTTDQSSPGYFALANVDFYDGAGWTFYRTFRPSGGVLPDDADAQLRTTRAVTQQYRIEAPALTRSPWMPFLYRAQRVTGTPVNIDPASGMIVPADTLRVGATYTVQSGIGSTTFDRLAASTASPDTATPTIDTQLPGTLRTVLDRLVKAFSDETRVPSSPALPFLQAVQRDLRSRYSLSGAAQGSATGTPAASSSAAAPTTTSPTTTTPKTTPKTTPRTTPTKAPTTTPRRSSPPPRHHTRGENVRPLATKSSAARTTPRASTSAPTRASTPPPSTAPTSTPAAPSSSSSSGSARSDRAGSTGFADVLASILGPGRSGTPEQFATLLALMARDLGVPARVVTGFRVTPAHGATALPAGSYHVTTADAWTWAEVPIVGAGWVVLDGSPSRFSSDQKQTQSGAPPPSTSSAPPSQNALVTQGDNGHAVAPKSEVAGSSAATHAALIAVLLAIGVLILVLLIVLLTRKRFRAARRRRSPDPRARLVGAWQESLDVLTEAGLPELTALTSAEIAAMTGEQFGPDAGVEAAHLGSAANAVTYSHATVITAQDADVAWARHRTLRRSVRTRLGMRGRLAAGLRYHRTGTTTRPVSPGSWAERLPGDKAREPRGPRRRNYRGRRRAH